MYISEKAKRVKALLDEVSGDEKTGVQIVLKALEAPVRQIAANAGFDGGGSKTACCLCDEKGTLLGTGLGGSSNYLFSDRKEAAQAMKDAADAFGQ